MGVSIFPTTVGVSWFSILPPMRSLRKASNLSRPSLLTVAPSDHTREKMKVDWGERKGGEDKKEGRRG